MALAGLITLIATLMWNRFVGVYKKAQQSIRMTLTQPIVHHHHPEPEEPKPIPPLLHEAVLQTVTLLENSAASGKLIRELELRTKTGASIVGIERDAESLVNPGPDEELKSGDKVLILGTQDHLQKAADFLVSIAVVEEKKPKRRLRKKTTTTRRKPFTRTKSAA
jgi:CPA2 family monovalent cation:H+ antiporter-2